MKRNFAFAGALVLAFASVPLVAAPKEGSYRSEGCFHGQHFMSALSKDAMGGSYTGVTTQLAAGENDFWHNVAGKCNGAWTLIGGEYDEFGTCEYSDATGDKFFGLYTRKGPDGTWKVLGGTGKFVGIESAGTWTPYTQYAAMPGEAASCFHQTGRYKLK